MSDLSLSVGRDYQTGLHSRYEFCLFDGEKIIARKGGFKSAAQARRQGLNAAKMVQ